MPGKAYLKKIFAKFVSDIAAPLKILNVRVWGYKLYFRISGAKDDIVRCRRYEKLKSAGENHVA